ncbi:MAG TPA: ferredoxin-type protein NapF, partial [Croceibacterium sp.]
TRFRQACTGCGDCIAACPERVLAPGEGGFPTFDPALGECLFCGECVTACESRALDPLRLDRPWQLEAAVSAGCLARNGVTCFACRDACGESAIRFRPALGGAVPEIDAARCTGCGACVGPCPVTAISLSARVAADG